MNQLLNTRLPTTINKILKLNLQNINIKIQQPIQCIENKQSKLNFFIGIHRNICTMQTISKPPILYHQHQKYYSLQFNLFYRRYQQQPYKQFSIFSVNYIFKQNAKEIKNYHRYILSRKSIENTSNKIILGCSDIQNKTFCCSSIDSAKQNNNNNNNNNDGKSTKELNLNNVEKKRSVKMILSSGACPIYYATDDERNMAFGRPCSPHVTIYHWELPGIMSGSHRMTGIMLSSYTLVLAFGTLMLPNNLEYYLTLLEDYQLNWYLLAITKSVLALPFIYHYVNGLRHLIWDTGKMLEMKDVYTSGYTVMSIVAFLSLGIGFLL